MHVADFANACGRTLQPLQRKPNTNSESTSNTDLAILQKSLQSLQQEYSQEKERMLAMQKVNTNLETSLNKFIQLHTDEKNERKELMTKVEAYTKKYYRLYGICIVLLVILLIQYLPIL